MHPMGIGMQLNRRQKDGSCFPVEISLSPVKSANSFRVTAIILDITQRKRANSSFKTFRTNMS
jgi:PAS domain S-box-containing protein